jgi:hypothetical protein
VKDPPEVPGKRLQTLNDDRPNTFLEKAVVMKRKILN